MAKVILDAGHGGYDGGASYNGRLEKNDNLAIALAVGEELRQNGIEVGYTRTMDVYDSPNEKARIANAQGADLFVSIHRNSSPNPNTYSGVETLLYEESGLRREVGEAINEELSKVGFSNLGLNVRKDLAVLRRTQMPAVLVEVGFINTEADNQRLDSNFDAVARAIANGITRTLIGEVNPGNPDIEQSPSYGREYLVQVGLYREYRNAVNVAYELEAMGFPVELNVSGDLYAVQVGPFRLQNEAIAVENQLQLMGYETLLLGYAPETGTAR